MKKTFPIAVLFVLAACSTLDPAPAYSQVGTVSQDDIIMLAESDISDQTILTLLRNRQIDFVLDAEGIRRLREAGVSEDVIEYLLDKDAAPTAVVRTYVTPTRYRSVYPSYYYGPRLVGTGLYPLGWYDHHYFGLNHPASWTYASYFSRSHDLGRTEYPSFGHGRVLLHSSGFLGGHQSQLGHSIGYAGRGLEHNGGHVLGGHSGGHGGGGHVGGHSGGGHSSGGHGSGH